MGLVFSKDENTNSNHSYLADRTTDSVLSSSKHNARQSSIRIKCKQPMPDPSELERRFTKVLVSCICII